jgi:hypothetical protein
MYTFCSPFAICSFRAWEGAKAKPPRGRPPNSSLPRSALAPAAGTPAAPERPAYPCPSEPADRARRSAACRFDGREILGRGAEAKGPGPRGCLGTESPGEQHQRRRRKSERNFAHESLLMCRERIAPCCSAPIWFDASRSIAQLRRDFTRRRKTSRLRPSPGGGGSGRGVEGKDSSPSRSRSLLTPLHAPTRARVADLPARSRSACCIELHGGTASLRRRQGGSVRAWRVCSPLKGGLKIIRKAIRNLGRFGARGRFGGGLAAAFIFALPLRCLSARRPHRRPRGSRSGRYRA